MSSQSKKQKKKGSESSTVKLPTFDGKVKNFTMF